MAEADTRRVGERGQVTIPKRLRESFGISGGDEVDIRAESGKIVIEKSPTREELAEGYRKRADRARELASAFEGTSSEASASLDEPPEWD